VQILNQIQEMFGVNKKLISLRRVFEVVGLIFPFLEALSKYYSLNADDLEITYLKDRVSGLDNPVRSINYKTPELKITAVFYPDLRQQPVTETPLTKLTVILKMDSSYASETEFNEELAKPVTDHYGAPTFTGHASYSWCARVDPEVSVCDIKSAVFSINSSGWPQGSRILLKDPTVTSLFNKAVNK